MLLLLLLLLLWGYCQGQVWWGGGKRGEERTPPKSPRSRDLRCGWHEICGVWGRCGVVCDMIFGNEMEGVGDETAHPVV
jgi:hypothetical protein